MPVSIIFPRRKGQIGSLPIETTISENHTFSATASRFPIDGGSIVSDHLVNDPEEIKIEGFISNTPLMGDVDNYAQQAFDALYEMWDKKELVKVATNYKIYTDMAITNITVPHNQKSGHAIQFSVDLMKIRKVQASTVSVFQETLAAPVVDQASSSLDLGAVTTAPASATTTTLANNKLLEYSETGVA